MPSLRIEAIEVSNDTLDEIEEKYGMGTYEIMEDLAQAARDRLQELKEGL